ncbi:thioesterase domain-containing protein, partial [Streptosporangium sp. NPDC048865]|uniref:thioesterase II family protein n=1 Tax=Streptosporangium sp. NPDC048865 TaxID=3155766 RepID=UPI003445A052
MTTTRVLDRAARAVSFPAPRPRAAIRLFCLPYAGGGSVEYQQWADLLPEAVEVVPVHLPGRERRFREAPHTAMDGLVAELAGALAPHLGRPYALFGYSMGAVVVEMGLPGRSDLGAVHIATHGAARVCGQA